MIHLLATIPPKYAPRRYVTHSRHVSTASQVGVHSAAGKASKFQYIAIDWHAVSERIWRMGWR